MRCGGGTNYRYGLFDEIVIKDNHIAAAGGIANALGAVPVQSEVEGFVELVEGVAHGASQIMLDNFAVNDMRVAVERVRACSRDVRLEASGGFSLRDAREIALTGVDSISIGSITHSAPAIDIGLDALSAAR